MQRSAEGAMGGISNPYQQLQRPSEAGRSSTMNVSHRNKPKQVYNPLSKRIEFDCNNNKYLSLSNDYKGIIKRDIA